MQDKNANYAVPALEKGLKVLQDLALSERALSLVELAELQGRSRNEVFRMVNFLEKAGYLLRDPESKHYSLSLKLFRLSHQHPPLERLRTVVERHLRQLTASIGESSHACVLDGNILTVIAQQSGKERIRLQFNYGAEFDPLETCSGKLLLSRYTGESLQRRLEAGRWKNLPAARRRAVIQVLEQARQGNFLMEESHLRPGVIDLAVVFGRPDLVMATVAVAHLPGRPRARSITLIERNLRRTVRRIEEDLGL